jgi:hypothetical protein
MRRHAVRLVQLHEIVPDGIERDHMHMILELLAERIRESCKATHLHAHREVLTFSI